MYNSAKFLNTRELQHKSIEIQEIQDAVKTRNKNTLGILKSRSGVSYSVAQEAIEIINKNEANGFQAFDNAKKSGQLIDLSLLESVLESLKISTHPKSTAEAVLNPDVEQPYLSVIRCWEKFRNLQYQEQFAALIKDITKSQPSTTSDNLKEKFPLLWEEWQKIILIDNTRENNSDLSGFILNKKNAWHEVVSNNIDKDLKTILQSSQQIQNVINYVTEKYNPSTPQQWQDHVEKTFDALHFHPTVCKAMGEYVKSQKEGTVDAFIDAALTAFQEADRKRILGTDDENSVMTLAAIMREREDRAKEAAQKAGLGEGFAKRMARAAAADARHFLRRDS